MMRNFVLSDIVLVGHSYGGVVVRHVADRMPDRIRSLVYLDAFFPEDGKATRCRVLKRRHGSAAPATAFQPSDTFRASGFDSPFGQFYAKAGERGWWQAELACGRDVMLDMPNDLTALLLQRT
jgi:pimeloyl-ACP methyl ester carboxylesterase